MFLIRWTDLELFEVTEAVALLQIWAGTRETDECASHAAEDRGVVTGIVEMVIRVFGVGEENGVQGCFGIGDACVEYQHQKAVLALCPVDIEDGIPTQWTDGVRTRGAGQVSEHTL